MYRLRLGGGHAGKVAACDAEALARSALEVGHSPEITINTADEQALNGLGVGIHGAAMAVGLDAAERHPRCGLELDGVEGAFRKLAQEKSKKDPIDCRPADLKKPGMEDLRKALREKGIKDDDEHCVIYAMFPQQLEDLYKKPRSAFELKKPEDKIKAEAPKGKISPEKLRITIDGESKDVTVQPL